MCVGGVFVCARVCVGESERAKERRCMREWNENVRELVFQRVKDKARERERERKEKREKTAHLQTKRDAIGEQVGFGREHVRTDWREKHARHVWVYH